MLTQHVHWNSLQWFIEENHLLQFVDWLSKLFKAFLVQNSPKVALDSVVHNTQHMAPQHDHENSNNNSWLIEKKQLNDYIPTIK